MVGRRNGGAKHGSGPGQLVRQVEEGSGCKVGWMNETRIRGTERDRMPAAEISAICSILCCLELTKFTEPQEQLERYCTGEGVQHHGRQLV
jgi:hypothetical protein